MAQTKPVAVVVGVGAGLGAALGRRFAEGFAVALVARSDDVTSGLAKDIRAVGGVALPVQSDATDEDLLKPSAIADTFWFLAHQDPRAWSNEIDVRPFKERF